MAENIFNEKKKPVEVPIEATAQKAVISPDVTAPAGANNGHYAAVNIIDLVHIRQEYNKGEVVVFDDLNISIPDIKGRGQLVSLLGQSGCGKSTILNYLSNLAEPTSGSIFVHGKPQDENSTIPMIFQQYSSFEWYSVLDNVALPFKLKGMSEKEAREKAQHLIDVVGLTGHEKKWAKYPTLSGGQLQRVAIARSLAKTSDYLLMDEPLGALDTVTRNQMQDMIRGIFEKDNNLDPTFILVTHDIREAIYLSDIIFILGGKPATVKHIIEIDLPDHRDQITKRLPKFFEYVDKIDELTNNTK